MKLISQVIVTSSIDETVTMLDKLCISERMVKIIEEDKSFSVEDAKIAIEKAYMASEEITVIVLGAKIFSPIVQNKLLKVIEEPPKNTEFILVTYSKSTILDTIKSRLPIVIRLNDKVEDDLGLNLKQLSLSTVYEFIQTHKRTNTKEMSIIIERIAKESMNSLAFDLDEKTLSLFSNCTMALDMGSPPQFVLNALLLKLLARKKR